MWECSFSVLNRYGVVDVNVCALCSCDRGLRGPGWKITHRAGLCLLLIFLVKLLLIHRNFKEFSHSFIPVYYNREYCNLQSINNVIEDGTKSLGKILKI